jgi:hypothetical protein
VLDPAAQSTLVRGICAQTGAYSFVQVGGVTTTGSHVYACIRVPDAIGLGEVPSLQVQLESVRVPVAHIGGFIAHLHVPL